MMRSEGDGMMELSVGCSRGYERRWLWWWLWYDEGEEVGRVLWRRLKAIEGCREMMGLKEGTVACDGWCFRMMMIHNGEERRGGIARGFFLFFLSSLDFFSLKTSSFPPTIETLAQLNNYKNNIFHKLLFLDRFHSQACKHEPQRPLFSFLFY